MLGAVVTEVGRFVGPVVAISLTVATLLRPEADLSISSAKSKPQKKRNKLFFRNNLESFLGPLGYFCLFTQPHLTVSDQYLRISNVVSLHLQATHRNQR